METDLLELSPEDMREVDEILELDEPFGHELKTMPRSVPVWEISRGLPEPIEPLPFPSASAKTSAKPAPKLCVTRIMRVEELLPLQAQCKPHTCFTVRAMPAIRI